MSCWAAGGGLVGGLALALLLEFLDTRIRTPGRYQEISGSGVGFGHAGDRQGRQTIWAGPPGMRSLPGTARELPRPFLLDRPNSPESEALRGIYTAVRLSWRNSGGAARVLMIASALPGEGKTMLSVNLALALAQHGSTCIVDADLRKRGVAPMLGVSAKHGLGDVLAGNMELDEAFVPHGSVPNLSVLAAGTAQGEPGMLIASNAMADLVGKLRQRFEFVVIDSPPILPVADARSLCRAGRRHSDGRTLRGDDPGEHETRRGDAARGSLGTGAGIRSECRGQSAALITAITSTDTGMIRRVPDNRKPVACSRRSASADCSRKFIHRRDSTDRKGVRYDQGFGQASFQDHRNAGTAGGSCNGPTRPVASTHGPGTNRNRRSLLFHRTHSPWLRHRRPARFPPPKY